MGMVLQSVEAQTKAYMYKGKKGHITRNFLTMTTHLDTQINAQNVHCT